MRRKVNKSAWLVEKNVLTKKKKTTRRIMLMMTVDMRRASAELWMDSTMPERR